MHLSSSNVLCTVEWNPSPALREREGPTPQAWEGEGLPLAQQSQNGFTHTFKIRQYLVVPKPQDTPAATFKPSRAVGILLSVRMLAAVGLDDKEILRTGKIDDVRPDRKLSPEFVPTEPP